MKVKTLSSFLRRRTTEFRVDFVRFLHDRKAVIGKYDDTRETAFVGVVTILSPTTRSKLRSTWRGKQPVVSLSREEGEQFPIVR